MVNESTVQDKLSITGNLKIEGERGKITVQVNLAAILGVALKSGKSPDKAFGQTFQCGEGLDLIKPAVGQVSYHKIKD